MTTPRKNWHDNRHRVLRYVGSKIRIVPRITAQLKATGAHTLVDVFGGSGAVVMNSGFDKRVFNDADQNIVHFFRTLADDNLRPRLIAKLERLPMSRAIFDHYRKPNFASWSDPIERAIAVFYISRFSFGGKISTGGFCATLSDRHGCKEIKSYDGVVAKLEAVAGWWKGTVIECLHYSELISSYTRGGVVFYCDPPYVGTERHYSVDFTTSDHVFLAEQLNAIPNPVVVSYYDDPDIRRLYSESQGWRYVAIDCVKNSMGRSKVKQKTTELLICRP